MFDLERQVEVGTGENSALSFAFAFDKDALYASFRLLTPVAS